MEALKYLWERRTTVLGYLITALGIMATSDLFSQTQIKWFLLINGILTAILGHYNNRQGLPEIPPKQGGFARPLMLALLLAVSVPVILILPGCASSPIKEAETFEQKSFALYGTYVVFQIKAAELVQGTTLPDSVKQSLRDADRVAYPIAESLVDAATTIGDIRDIIESCAALPTPESNPECVPSNEQKLANAITNLSTIYFQAQPIILNLVATVKDAR